MTSAKPTLSVPTDWIGLSDLAIPTTEVASAPLSLLQRLISVAREYHDGTGMHLSVARDLAGLFAAACYGITLNHALDGGPDGWLGQVPVYIRVIAPEARNALDPSETKAPQGHLFVVRISDTFDMQGKLFPCAFSRQDRLEDGKEMPKVTLAASA